MLQNSIDKIRLLFSKERESYYCFYRILGFYPHNIRLYQQAVRHKSFSSKDDQGKDNERLEFLGDAILDAIVGDIVFRHFDESQEGFLTNTRSKIVQRETLNKIAIEIGLDKLVRFSSKNLSHHNSVYGNAFEALIGAIYLDQGYRRCQQFMEKNILKHYIDLEKLSQKEMNFKSKLIEWSQKKKFELSFELIEQSLDENYNPIFHTEVRIEQQPVGSGTGYSKKESQQNAAQTALALLKNDPELKDKLQQLRDEREQRSRREEPQPATPEADSLPAPANEGGEPIQSRFPCDDLE